VPSQDIVEAFLANQQLERLQYYLQRGRPLSRVPLATLNAHWIGLMRAWVQNFTPRMDHREREDIEAELQLRKLEPPFDQAREVMDQLKQKSREQTDRLLADPLRLARTEISLREEIAEFEAENKDTKKN
jgi:hypothetical protein